MSGVLYLVSVGPGFAEHITDAARQAIRQSDVVIAYDLYLNWIKPWLAGKEVISMPLTKERERALQAIEFARAGRQVSLVSSGDIGIYGMAAFVFEEMADDDKFDLQVIPGISAANACASTVGAPLSHDFAVLSLSDLLCPWEIIENRARALAEADLVVALYNVQSKTRYKGIYKILDIMAEYKAPETHCAVVSNAYRPDSGSYICSLTDLQAKEFDMFTTIIIGNKYTRTKRGFLYTTRAVHSVEERLDYRLQEMPEATAWPVPGTGSGEKLALTPGPTQVNNSRLDSHQISLTFTVQHDAIPENAIWVFSGTSDGNLLANKLKALGYRLVLSTATEYGGNIAAHSCPGVFVLSGKLGADKRKEEILQSNARAIIDATHPYADTISRQLMHIAQDTGLPYVRYERPAAAHSQPGIFCGSIPEATALAMSLGNRIFLATGANEIAAFLNHPHAHSREWFVRITPQLESMEAAIKAGITRSNIIAMQGPFSAEINKLLWRQWQVDCVITRDSGLAGSFADKAAAAQELKIPLIVIARPNLSYPNVHNDLDTTIKQIENLGVR